MTADALAAALRTVPDFPKPGIQFKDITPILADPALLIEAAERSIAPFRGMGITHVAGIEARGFMLGGLLAQMLGAGFVPVRKKGKLPHDVFRATYALEYGVDEIEAHQDAFGPAARVLIHDDVIATGGTAAAAAAIVEQAGAHAVGFSFLIELAFLKGRQALPTGIPIHSVLVV